MTLGPGHQFFFFYRPTSKKPTSKNTETNLQEIKMVNFCGKNNLRFVAKWNKSIGVIKKRAGWGRFNKTFSVLQLTSCKFAIELFLVEVREVDLR